MNICQHCCPDVVLNCLRSIVVRFNKKIGTKKKREAGINQLEEEQFQFTPASKLHHNEEKQTNIKPPTAIQQKPPIQQHQQNLSIKLNLNQHRQGESQEKTNLLQEHEQQNKNITEFNFKNNLEPYDPYFTVIQSKSKNIQSIFQSHAKNILTRSTNSKISISEIQTITGFKMLINYTLPCSYSYYKSVNKDQQIVTKLNSVITSNRIIETIHPNLTINHLAFKKFMLLEPRFFNYLKYQNSSGNSHWQICISQKGRLQSQPSEKQCELTSISCLQQRKDHLIINSYLQIDLKSNLKAAKVVLRVYQQLASYINSLYDYCLHNYRQQHI